MQKTISFGNYSLGLRLIGNSINC